MIFIGDDWAEGHHDIYMQDADGIKLAKCRLPESIEGVTRFHELVARHVAEPSDAVIGIETEHGLFIEALVAGGYTVYAINPLSASRYRDRHSLSGAKSDPADAKLLADIVRTDRHNHRMIANDTNDVHATKVLARAHQNLIWARQTNTNVLRSTLREFYQAALEAFGDDLSSPDALFVLKAAPTPSLGAKLSTGQIEAALRHGGRKRNVASRAQEIQLHLRKTHLQAPDVVANAFGSSVAATVGLLSTYNTQIQSLQADLAANFDVHPDSEIIRSLPGLGPVLGARVLGEFGDDPNRYHDAKSRKNYASTSPITKASGKSKVVLARFTKNKRLADACDQWAFCSLTNSPGARALYDACRAKEQSHHQALRVVANRLVGLLHGCLKHRATYDEAIAWPEANKQVAAA